MYRKSRKKSEKIRDFSSPNVINDEDFKAFRESYDRLRDKYGLSAIELINKFEEIPLIPVSVFNEKLSSLETVVKYAKENLGLSYKEISKLINRSDKTVWQAHLFSKKKFPEKFAVKASRFNFPITILSDRRLSVLESIVLYLKEEFELSYHKIAVLLERDDRTIWTVYQRAKKKQNEFGKNK